MKPEKDFYAVELMVGRDCYSEEQVVDYYGGSMTVGELKDYLSQFDDDEIVLFNNDTGYTFGYLDRDRIVEKKVHVEKEEEVEEED